MLGNQLENKICTLNVHGEIADLINNERPVLGEDFEPARQTVLKKDLLSCSMG